nr:UDP-glucuronosyl UDP-glucosyltransferase domain containing protein [Haemonchus contortus]
MKVVFLLWLQLAHVTLAANILFLNTWNSKSHGLTMKPLATRLVERGNNVTIYTMLHNSIGPLGKGVNTLETVLRPDQSTRDQQTVDTLFWNFEMKPEIFEAPHKISYDYMMYSLEDEIFQKVMDTRWDVVILDELFAVAQGAMALALREKYGTKLATFATTDFSNQYSVYRGFSRNPIITPDYYTKGYNMMSFDVTNFFIRLASIRDLIYEQYYIVIACNRWLKKAGEVLNVYNTYDTIFEASHASLTDFPSGYGYPSPIGADLIHVGEYCQESKELPPHLKSFVEDPTSKGTIYIAFGSLVNWNAAKPEIISTFFDALNIFSDYRIIFSYAGPEVKNKKPHVKLLRWAPQNDILAHNKTVLFFTHGGLKSIKEGICSNTPMLFLPFFADQPRNALFARRLGIADVIYKMNITREELSSKINRVLTDTSFAVNTRKLHRQFLDHVMDPLDYGSRWIDRVGKIRDEQCDRASCGPYEDLSVQRGENQRTPQFQ